MKNRLNNILKTISKLGGDSRDLVYEKPAKETKLIAIEKQLGYKIPKEFRYILLNKTSHLEFKWFLDDDFELPDIFSELFSGEIHWGTDFIIDFNANKDDWIKECFSDPSSEYDKVWHNKFVFQEVGNGDYLSIDLSKENYGKIIYLSHDDGDGHGVVMANSFNQLLKDWLDLGCPGSEDWQWLPFTNDKINGIDSKCVNAKEWKKLIGIT